MLPGATVLYDGGILKLQIPSEDHRRHLQRFCSCRYFKDKINTLWLNRLQNLSIDEIFEQPEQTTQKQLTEYGFSKK
jgi:hypothetical protein